MYKDLDEQVSVIAVFEKGEMRPYRFLWQGRSFRIARVTGTWKAPKGDKWVRHFSVVDSSRTSSSSPTMSGACGGRLARCGWSSEGGSQAHGKHRKLADTVSMNTYNEMKEQQRNWGFLTGRHPDSKGYVETLEMNLFRQMSPETKADFSRGAGDELEEKMYALHSSSALACNVFDYWRVNGIAAVGKALGLKSPVDRFEFEAKLPTGLPGTAPNVDLLLRLESGEIWGIESKFTEPFCKPKGKEPFRDSYFPGGTPMWAAHRLPRCAELAQQLMDDPATFRHLDAAQLLKHVLGLSCESPGRFGLVYVYVDPGGTEAELHCREIDRFGRGVEGDFPFMGIAYSTLVQRLRMAAGDNHQDYFTYLSSRYGFGKTLSPKQPSYAELPAR